MRLVSHRQACRPDSRSSEPHTSAVGPRRRGARTVTTVTDGPSRVVSGTHCAEAHRSTAPRPTRGKMHLRRWPDVAAPARVPGAGAQSVGPSGNPARWRISASADRSACGHFSTCAPRWPHRAAARRAPAQWVPLTRDHFVVMSPPPDETRTTNPALPFRINLTYC